MENTKLIIGAIITLALVTSGVYYIAQEDQAYHCASRDLVMICEKLSSGIGTICYFESTYKTCKEGWVKIEIGQEVWDEKDPIKYIDNTPSTEGTKWLCSPEGCERLE